MAPSVAVVGGAGFIGSHMVKHLRRAGYSVTVLDDLSKGHRDAIGDAPLVEVDIRNRTAIADAVAACAPDLAMHFASLIEVGESYRDPATFYETNVVGSQWLVDACRAADCNRIVFSSSAAVYGEVDEPITEDHPLAPINPYGFTKMAVERLLSDYGAAYGISSIALRYFNAAGADMDGELAERHDPESHLIPRLLLAARAYAAGEPAEMAIFGTDFDTRDGTCVRDYVHVDDLCRAHLAAVERLLADEVSGAEQYNLGSETGHTVREVCEATRQVTGIDIPIREAERRAGDPARLVASAARAREVLGWQPEITELSDIIASAWRVMR